MKSWFFANFLYTVLVTVILKTPLFLVKNKIFTNILKIIVALFVQYIYKLYICIVIKNKH